MSKPVLTDVMIDTETLDTVPDSTVLTIGMVRFDPFGNDEKNPSYKTSYIKVCTESSAELGCTINPATLEWWSTQPLAAQEAAFCEEGRLSVVNALSEINKFCFGAQRFWCQGLAFDFPILENLYRKTQRLPPWKFWELRCSRTLFDIGINPQRPEVTAHNALDDAIAQALCVQRVFRTLKTSTTLEGNYITPFAKKR